MYYHHYIELISFLTGLFCFKKEWAIPYKLLVVLAGLTFFVEVTGQFLWNQYQYNNHWIYNLFIPLQHFVFLFFIKSAIVDLRVKPTLLFFIFLAIIVVPVTYFFHRNFFILNNYTATAMVFLLFLSSAAYYVDSMLNNIPIVIYKQPPFWIVSGLFFFCVIFIVRFSLWKFIVQIPEYKKILGYTNIVANTFLYGGLIGCFICLEKTKNYKLSS